MKPIPVETNELEISFEICPIDNIKVTQTRINKVRDKIKKLESDGEKSILLKLCEILIDIVEKWDKGRNIDLITQAIHCLQKASVCLAKEKFKFLNFKEKKS